VRLLAGAARADAERTTAFIPGLWTRGTGASPASGGPPAPFDIDDLPSPDRSLAPADRGVYFIDWMKPIALMRSTVGCPYRCSFARCGRSWTADTTSAAWTAWWPNCEIPEECVFLVDDEAFIHRRRMSELAEAIHAAGLRKRYQLLPYRHAAARSRPDEDVARDRSRALFIGIEAVSARDPWSTRRDSRWRDRGGPGLGAGPRHRGVRGFIVNTNFTARDFKQLVRFIEHNRVSYPSFTVLTPPPAMALTNFDSVIERQPNGDPIGSCSISSTGDPHDAAARGISARYRNLFQVSRRQLAAPPRGPHAARRGLTSVTGRFTQGETDLAAADLDHAFALQPACHIHHLGSRCQSAAELGDRRAAAAARVHDRLFDSAQPIGER
jgi:hypothetical protein